jgi:hypothetical protein
MHPVGTSAAPLTVQRCRCAGGASSVSRAEGAVSVMADLASLSVGRWLAAHMPTSEGFPQQRQMSTSSDNLAYVAHMHEQC